MHGDKTGKLVEHALGTVNGIVQRAHAVGEPLGNLQCRQLAFLFDKAGCLPFNHLFKVVSMLPQPGAHGYAFVRAVQGNFQHIVVDGLGNEICSVFLDALDGKVHVAMAGEHYHFRFRRFLLDALEKVKAAQTRHLDICKDNMGPDFIKDAQGFLAAGGGVHTVPHICQRQSENGSDAVFIVYEQYDMLHGIPLSSS